MLLNVGSTQPLASCGQAVVFARMTETCGSRTVAATVNFGTVVTFAVQTSAIVVLLKQSLFCLGAELPAGEEDEGMAIQHVVC